MVTMEYVRRRAGSDADSRGYKLHYDEDFLNDLIEGLKKNEERFGYPLCPCRVGSGVFELDRDIICPCDYRDLDVEEFGACYCALFIRKSIYEKKLPINPVPERRPPEKIARAMDEAIKAKEKTSAETQVVMEKPSATAPSQGAKAQEAEGKEKLRLWYCKQCGYVVFRGEPPYICPICKARREMFKEIKIEISESG
jgi:ferredoxin-thioredoxin reductase catalytic subunit/rubredoxin